MLICTWEMSDTVRKALMDCLLFSSRGEWGTCSCVGLVESEKKRLFPCAIWDKRDAVIEETTEGRIQIVAVWDALPCLSREPESGSNRQQDV